MYFKCEICESNKRIHTYYKTPIIRKNNPAGTLYYTNCPKCKTLLLVKKLFQK